MNQPQPYDSRADTEHHIARVNSLLLDCSLNLAKRGEVHDASKLIEPEKSVFDALVPKLKDFAYGSDEYKACLKELQPALANHYAANSHHPEHFTNGVEGMTIFDFTEMLMDWKAASERMKDGGNIRKSIEINTPRFNLSPQLVALLNNTVKEMGW